jgi:hypothetical protein
MQKEIDRERKKERKKETKKQVVYDLDPALHLPKRGAVCMNNEKPTGPGEGQSGITLAL